MFFLVNMLEKLTHRDLECFSCGKLGNFLPLNSGFELYCNNCGVVNYYPQLSPEFISFKIDHSKRKQFHSDNLRLRIRKFLYESYLDIQPYSSLTIKKFADKFYPHLNKQNE